MKRTELKRKTPLLNTKPMQRARSTKAPAARKTLKTKQRAVTAKEKELWSRLAALGCVACMKDGRHNPHVSIHHVDGRTKPGCHLLVLPLCAGHHQDGTGAPGLIAVHPWKAQFEERYGDQRMLVLECMKMLKQEAQCPQF